ncbi:MAG TPA: hypothetical protein VEW94_11860 [Chloroflexia bacterium]|nr:hypothetical protein [Chloroflexia bacterium]
MATATANRAPAQAAPTTVSTGNRRVAGLRSWMLTLISSAIAFGVLTGLLAWQANLTTYNDYHTIVDEGSVSVDAALRARAAVLDHMSAAATFLETTGEAQQAAAARVQERWTAFNNEARVSWRNITDSTHGESNVYASADRAASDYIQQIGSMFAYYNTNQRDRAGEAFLAARETLNTRLVPALTGLEAVKVEAMEATYAGAAERITRWRYALIGVAGFLTLILLMGLLAIRRLRYRWSWPVGLPLIVSLLLAVLMQEQLAQASNDARVMVRQAYDSVAGVQDVSANLSQARALESIAIFDPEQSALHLASFDQYNDLVEQRLCGPRDCTANTFVSSQDRIAPAVIEAALNEQGLLGLPRTPLVANVNFAGQAAAYEQLRTDYRAWLDAHSQLETQVRAGDIAAASATSAGESAATFAKVVESINSANRVARAEYDKIWQRVYTVSTLNQGLAILFPLSGLFAAWGLWRRRSELYA